MRGNVKLVVIILAVAALLVIPAQAAKQKTGGEKTLITPGQTIGAFHVGMTLDRVGKIAGKPYRQETKGSITEWTYLIKGDKTNYSFKFRALKTSRNVVELLTDMPDYRTIEGFGIGTKLDDVKKKWGEPDSVTELANGNKGVDYQKLGIGFNVSGKDGRITLVKVSETEE